MNWSIEKSKKLYGLDKWGNKYFDINKKGNIEVTPTGPNGLRLDLHTLISELKARGINTPIMLRFTDITKERIKVLNSCFNQSISEYKYPAKYRSVFPIKVNQQMHLIEEILDFGKDFSIGLECGSKPELLVVLAMMNESDGPIICNGFKDSEYIETALLASKLGKNITLVIDRYEELEIVLQTAEIHKVKPKIGFRVKLHSKTAGKWQDSAGDRSKFGLTLSEIFKAFEVLKNQNSIDSLELLHFHMGSQIPTISNIKQSLKEVSRIYIELKKMGAPLKVLDVGGGLGVDYDGSNLSHSSINYTEQEYSNDVVSIIQTMCDESSIDCPDIVTECGRSMVAHQSLLVFDVLGANKVAAPTLPDKSKLESHKFITELLDIHRDLNVKNAKEAFHDIQHIKDTSLQLFTFGLVSLKQKAQIDSLCWNNLTKLQSISKEEKDLSALHAELQDLLSDTYFCNFSIFQSLPDSWALDQVFPVMPLHRHTEEPNRKAILVDLTCDSDGKITNFVDSENGINKSTLNVHSLSSKETYYLGVFLVGAYQETLGDLHNLFGDTNAVHITMTGNGKYRIKDYIEGDRVDEVLSYVQYNKEDLLKRMRDLCEKGISNEMIRPEDAASLMKVYSEGLAGYTYLE